MRILIIRHGDPDYAKDSLTEKGWREANLLSERLSKAGITDFFASPLRRAQHTAAPTLDRIESDTGTRPQLEILEWLREFPASIDLDLVPYGAPAGSPRLTCPWNMPPQFWSEQPEFFTNDWRENPIYRDEKCKVADVYTRVLSGWNELTARFGYKRRESNGGESANIPGIIYDVAPDAKKHAVIALFCHLGLGNALLSAITGIPLPLFWKSFFLPTTSVTTVLMEEDPLFPGHPQARIIGLGDVSHLYAGGEPTSSSGLKCNIE